MKRHGIHILLYAILVLALISTIVISFNTFKMASSKIPEGTYILPPIVDFGLKASGETLQIPFSIVNRSGRAVQIKSMSASCGCIKVQTENDQRTIHPNSTVKLNVVIKTSTIGEARYQILLDTNSIPLQCEIMGTIFTDKPDQFHHRIGNFYPGEKIEKTIRFIKHNQSAEIRLEHPGEGLLHYTLEDNNNPKMYRIRVLGTAPKVCGTFEENLTVNATHELWTRKTLNLTGTVVPRWHLDITPFFCGRVSPNADIRGSRILSPQIVGDTLSQVKIAESICTLSDFKCTLQKDNSSGKIEFTAKAPSVKGRFHDFIKIRVEQSQEKSQDFEIPILGVVE